MERPRNQGEIMAEAVSASAIKRQSQPSFFFWMSVIMTAFILSGFGLTYLKPIATGSLTPLPPVVHLHGIFYFAWMLLLVVQPLLIQVKNVTLHRSLGTFGIFIATCVLALGSLLTVLFMEVGGKDPAPDYYNLSYLSVVALLGFGLLFCLAIRSTRKPEGHKRLMLLATINLLPPGINRLYMVSFGLTDVPLLATWLTLDALAIAVVIYDLRSSGRVSRATLTGASVVVLPQLLYPVIVGSEAFASLCRVLGSMAYYR
jgi:hypothetical protein